MTSIQDYLDNPHWEAIYRYAMGPPNGGYYKRWVQGSVGGNHPMFLWANEYAHTSMKHGQNNINPYRSGIKNFAPSVTPKLQQQVVNCSEHTLNPGGCQTAAIRKVYSLDSSPSFNEHEHPGVSRHVPDITPHPYGVSYKTGFSPNMASIPPNGLKG